MSGHEPREERPHSPGLAPHSPSRSVEANETGDSLGSNKVNPGFHSVVPGAHGAHGARDGELAAVLAGISGPSGEFRHRQHINLAFYAVRRYGMPEAVGTICGWIQQIAAYERAPQKYHHTVSRAWVELVAHHVAADPGCADFAVFAERNPALLDKRLLGRHYRSSTLAAGPARHGWVEPDLLPFPWSAQDSTAG
jgi:hypothetical protein